MHQHRIILDGGPQIVMFVVDGVLCDGASTQLRGWQWLEPALVGDLGGAGATGIDIGGSGSVREDGALKQGSSATASVPGGASGFGAASGTDYYGGKVLGARVYSRALKVSEMVGNAQAGPPTATGPQRTV